MEINLLHNTFTLLPQRAMIWKEKRMLILGDLHIGKISHFRHAGIAVPAAALAENFVRLDSILQRHPVNEILFAGDLFHSSINNEWQLFTEWRMQYSNIPVNIVPGNHDTRALPFYRDAFLQILDDEHKIGPFTFSHHPKTAFAENEYVISGHVHPVIQLTGAGRQYLKFPCFYFGKQQCILPAFGNFTGGYSIKPEKGDTFIALVNESLIDVSESAR